MSYKPFTFLLFIIFWSCSNTEKTEEYSPPKPSKESGLVLAQTYCVSCHKFPEPSLVEKAIWEESILPKMAYRLGLEKDIFKLYGGYDQEELEIIGSSAIYPEHPQIAEEDWAKIVKYYLDNTPDKPLPQSKKEPISIGLQDFKVKKLYGITNKTPFVTLVKFNPNQSCFYVGFRGGESFLKQYDLNLSQKDSVLV
jgi:hypothetical protein